MPNSTPRSRGGGRRPRKKTVPETPSASPPVSVTPEQRYRMIQEAAYYKAEKDGFRQDPKVYWLAAEAEIDAQLSRKPDPGS